MAAVQRRLDAAYARIDEDEDRAFAALSEIVSRSGSRLGDGRPAPEGIVPELWPLMQLHFRAGDELRGAVETFQNSSEETQRMLAVGSARRHGLLSGIAPVSGARPPQQSAQSSASPSAATPAQPATASSTSPAGAGQSERAPAIRVDQATSTQPASAPLVPAAPSQPRAASPQPSSSAPAAASSDGYLQGRYSDHRVMADLAALHRHPDFAAAVAAAQAREAAASQRANPAAPSTVASERARPEEQPAAAPQTASSAPAAQPAAPLRAAGPQGDPLWAQAQSLLAEARATIEGVRQSQQARPGQSDIIPQAAIRADQAAIQQPAAVAVSPAPSQPSAGIQRPAAGSSNIPAGYSSAGMMPGRFSPGRHMFDKAMVPAENPLTDALNSDSARGARLAAGAAVAAQASLQSSVPGYLARVVSPVLAGAQAMQTASNAFSFLGDPELERNLQRLSQLANPQAGSQNGPSTQVPAVAARPEAQSSASPSLSGSGDERVGAAIVTQPAVANQPSAAAQPQVIIPRPSEGPALQVGAGGPSPVSGVPDGIDPEAWRLLQGVGISLDDGDDDAVVSFLRITPLNHQRVWAEELLRRTAGARVGAAGAPMAAADQLAPSNAPAPTPTVIIPPSSATAAGQLAASNAPAAQPTVIIPRSAAVPEGVAPQPAAGVSQSVSSSTPSSEPTNQSAAGAGGPSAGTESMDSPD
jgi:hypothetical protein